MGNDKVASEKRIVVGPTFSLNFQHIFSTAISSKLKEELKKNFAFVEGYSTTGRMKGISKRLKDDFLKEFFGVNDEESLLKNNHIIAEMHSKLTDEIHDESGLANKEFTKWCTDKLNLYLEEVKKKNGNK